VGGSADVDQLFGLVHAETEALAGGEAESWIQNQYGGSAGNGQKWAEGAAEETETFFAALKVGDACRQEPPVRTAVDVAGVRDNDDGGDPGVQTHVDALDRLMELLVHRLVESRQRVVLRSGEN
jgi:hypothetical protein